MSAVVFDRRTPTWSALGLDRHLLVIKCSLGLYLPLLVALWLKVLGKWEPGEAVAEILGWGLGLSFVAMTAEAAYVQKALHDCALYKHGADHVIVGALLLSPCLFGWWIPASVLLTAARVRKQVDEFTAGREAAGPADQSGEPLPVRAIDFSWRRVGRPLGCTVALLLLLLALWFLANPDLRKDKAPSEGHTAAPVDSRR